MACGRKLKNKVKLALVTRNIYHNPQKTCNLFHKRLAPRQFSKISQHFVEWINIKETIQEISKIFSKATGCESKKKKKNIFKTTSLEPNYVSWVTQ